MSSYFTISLRPKRSGGDLSLVSYSRVSEVYDELYEGTTDSQGELTKEKIDGIVSNLEAKISRDKDQLHKYHELAKSNTEYVEDYISFGEYVDNEIETLNKIKTIQDIVHDTYDGYNSFESVNWKIE